MRAVEVTTIGQVSTTHVSEPDPGDRALVDVERSGLCGTDVKILHGDIPAALPLVVGHEVVGRVRRPGSRSLVSAGTRVLVNPASWCGDCHLCVTDRAHLCANGSLMGRDVDGGLTEQIAVDERQLHPIPDGIDGEAASLLQVLGTCVHAQTLVEVFPGQTAAVLGLGVSGLLHTQLLRERGVNRLVGITRSAWKRDAAQTMGANVTARPDAAAEEVAELTDGRGVDLVVEAAGSPTTMALAVELAAMGGTILAYGIAPRLPVDFPAYQLYFKELRLLNARAARGRDYDRGIELAASGRLDLGPLSTHDFPLANANAAFAALDDERALKVSLVVD